MVFIIAVIAFGAGFMAGLNVAWADGHISKAEYNRIVSKANDKLHGAK